jgi:hypothetical protein
MSTSSSLTKLIHRYKGFSTSERKKKKTLIVISLYEFGCYETPIVLDHCPQPSCRQLATLLRSQVSDPRWGDGMTRQTLSVKAVAAYPLTALLNEWCTLQQTHLEEDRTGKRREAELRADGGGRIGRWRWQMGGRRWAKTACQQDNRR